MSDFPKFPKIPRLSRECIISEKIDGMNGLIEIWENPGYAYVKDSTFKVDNLLLRAGSRSRWLDTTSKGDNYGFAKWVQGNAEDLIRLGVGLHYGEWWGKGIQRNYGLAERRFSLFNTSRWSDPSSRPACCDVVPVLYHGLFTSEMVHSHMGALMVQGSKAAPGWMQPEGVIVYHIAANKYFKKTIEGDQEYKGNK